MWVTQKSGRRMFISNLHPETAHPNNESNGAYTHAATTRTIAIVGCLEGLRRIGSFDITNRPTSIPLRVTFQPMTTTTKPNNIRSSSPEAAYHVSSATRKNALAAL